MTPKKKRKPPAAQQLIDSLLDERTPTDSHEPTPLDFASDPGHDFGVADIKPKADSPKIKAMADKAAPPAAAKKPAINDDRTQVAPSPKEKSGPPQTISLGSPDVSSVDLSLEDDRTMQISPKGPLAKHEVNEPSLAPTATEMMKPAERSEIDRAGLTELKTVVKMRDRLQEPRSAHRPAGGGGFTSSDAVLKQSENLRIAQNRITELEHELERLRRDNEQLATAGETLRRRSDELLTKAEQLEIQLKESERTHDEEKKVFRGQLHAKDREIAEMRGRLEEMESRLESNFKKIRVRERELEHRLEIVRMESQTLVATKDKMILELKRQIDQITHENDYAKHKAQEHFNQYKEKQETIRRVVRALRIALTILEGDEDAGIKKPD